MLLLGCTTTSTKLAAAGNIGTPAANAKVLLVQPDVQLSVLTAAGLQEARADWSKQGQDDLSADIATALRGRSHPFQSVDPALLAEGRTGQLMRLHEAVGQSIMAFSYALPLPTKKDGFDWTLGEGAQALGRGQGADYALFVTARGSYASAGRKAMMIGAAMLGVSMPLGSQQVFASLVDLKTGRVVWFNMALAGPSADIRTPDGSKSLVASLLKGAPL
jgi:hypothetical protein